MPRQNRVTPFGELVAVADRGMFWGNRGRLLDRHGSLARYFATRAWLICLLEFKERRRQLWRPDRLTELFFLDEATALAAGHRPCGECRARELRAFKQAWAAAHPGGAVRAAAIDAQLHADRLIGPGLRRMYRAPPHRLPPGTMVEVDGRAWLVADGELLEWTPGGYRQRRPLPAAVQLSVITPRGTVATLSAGYRPVLHATATRPIAIARHPGS